MLAFAVAMAVTVVPTAHAAGADRQANRAGDDHTVPFLLQRHDLRVVGGGGGVVEIRIGGGRPMLPQRLNLPAPPRLIRGSMLPSTAQLLDVAVEERVVAAVAALDDPSWAARDAAAQALRTLDVGEEQLLGMLVQGASRGKLSAEQWHRLLEIACERLRETPRGAMGIRMDRRLDGFGGVLVSDLLPGLPAERVLKIGDRIIEIDGRPIADSEELIEMVQLRRPGDQIALRLLRPRRDDAGAEMMVRPGQIAVDEVSLSMELGDAEHLDRFGDMPAGGGMNSVSRLRAEQSAEARLRFAMPPVAVPVAGSGLAAEVALLPDPDEHEAITTLRLYRQLLDEGVITATPSMRRAWQSTLDLLERQASSPELSESVRAHLREVARRYAELIPAP